jgi:N4-gp56 family major capsid protein
MPANVIGSSYSSLIQEHYDRKLLATREITNDLLAYGKKAIIPKGNSDIIHWNRVELYSTAQDVTDGTDLSTPQTPSVTEIKGKLALFGDFVSFSPYGDEIRIASLIDNSYDQMVLQAARTANRKLQTVLSNGDVTTGNSFSAFKKMYAGAATSFADLVAGGSFKLTSKDIQRAVGFLKKQGAKGPITCLMNAWGYEDLMINDQEFRDLIKNQDLAILKTNELPQWSGAKIGWQDDPWRENLAASGGAEGTYAAAGAVHTTWIFGQDSFGTVQLMGRNGLKPKFKVQDISKIGTEVTIGYFMPFKGGALNPNWGVALRSVATNPEVSSVA